MYSYIFTALLETATAASLYIIILSSYTVTVFKNQNYIMAFTCRMVGVIEDLKKLVEEKELQQEELSTRVDGTLKVLAGVRAGLEHVAEKLEVITLLRMSINFQGFK